MDTSKIKVFYYLAKLGTLTKAAEHLRLQVPTASKQLASLENELGYKLTTSDKVRHTLTPEGRAFVKYAHAIMEQERHALKEMELCRTDISGDLVISTTNAITVQYMSEALSSFSLKHPNLSISIIGTDDPSTLNYHEIDVDIRPTSPSPLMDAALPLLRYYFHLYASEKYLAKHGPVKTLDDLATHKIIAYGQPMAFPYKEVNWHLEYLPEDFKPSYSINTGAGILSATEWHMGIAPISQLGANISKTPLVKVLPELVTGPTMHLHFRFADGQKNSLKIIAAYECIKAWSIKNQCFLDE